MHMRRRKTLGVDHAIRAFGQSGKGLSPAPVGEPRVRRVTADFVKYCEYPAANFPQQPISTRSAEFVGAVERAIARHER